MVASTTRAGDGAQNCGGDWVACRADPQKVAPQPRVDGTKSHGAATARVRHEPCHPCCGARKRASCWARGHFWRYPSRGHARRLRSGSTGRTCCGGNAPPDVGARGDTRQAAQRADVSCIPASPPHTIGRPGSLQEARSDRSACGIAKGVGQCSRPLRGRGSSTRERGWRGGCCTARRTVVGLRGKRTDSLAAARKLVY